MPARDAYASTRESAARARGADARAPNAYASARESAARAPERDAAEKQTRHPAFRRMARLF